MKIMSFLVSDAATDSAGKLNILGAFDTVNVGMVPATISHMAISLRIRFDNKESGDYPFKLEVKTPEGKDVVPSLNGNIHVEKSDNIISPHTNLIFNLNNVKVQTLGKHEVKISINGETIDSLPLYVSVLK